MNKYELNPLGDDVFTKFGNNLNFHFDFTLNSKLLIQAWELSNDLLGALWIQFGGLLWDQFKDE